MNKYRKNIGIKSMKKLKVILFEVEVRKFLEIKL